jgi:aspartate carbamoyltransferase catalytic subunit
VVENYADVIVIRHPWEGAAQVAADFASVPVINAGDGSHEHPTQTLCDLYTLRASRQEKVQRRRSKGGHSRSRDDTRTLLRDLNVVLAGDLRHGRTVHSLVYALARFGVNMVPLPAPGCELPIHVRNRLRRDYGSIEVSLKDNDVPADVVYVTPDQPHLQAFYELDASIKFTSSRMAIYATRLQTERRSSGEQLADYQVVDRRFLRDRHFRKAEVMHPLPRVDELSYELDTDKRGVYFKQAAYGVPVRMALVAALLGLAEGVRIDGGHKEGRYRRYSQKLGVRCQNPACVTAQESEWRYLQNRFWIVDENPVTLRCAYCDFEVQPSLAGRLSRRTLLKAIDQWSTMSPDDLVFFRDPAEAAAAGFKVPSGRRREGAPTRRDQDGKSSEG